MDYNIYAGLGGSFGGATYYGTLKNVTELEASEYAYEVAVEEFEGYEGLYGLCSNEDFLEEYPEGTEEDYEEFRNQAIEDWVEYAAIPVNEDSELDSEEEIHYLN